MIFFDFDSAEINQPGYWRALEQFASDEKKSSGGGRIFICGYADRAGSREANLAISQRRVVAVRDALVALGIPADQMSVLGVGDRDLLVPTPAGVREAQNRRAIVELEHLLGLGSHHCKPLFEGIQPVDPD